MTRRVLTVGTRGSALALAQSAAVAAVLAESAGAVSDLVRIKTEGDVNAGPLASIGGTGIFVTALRSALLDGRVDVVEERLDRQPDPTGPDTGPDPVTGIRRRPDFCAAGCCANARVTRPTPAAVDSAADWSGVPVDPAKLAASGIRGTVQG